MFQVIASRKDRFGKVRVYFTPLERLEEPKGPLCVDPKCESYICQSEHLTSEVDHEVWKAFTRYATLVQRKLIERAVAGEAPVAIFQASTWYPNYLVAHDFHRITELRFSAKAGCSCGCSPGFIAGQQYGSYDFHVEEVEGPELPVSQDWNRD